MTEPLEKSIVEQRYRDDIVALPNGEIIILPSTAAAIIGLFVERIKSEKPWIDTDELSEKIWPNESRQHYTSRLTPHLSICRRALRGSGFSIEEKWKSISLVGAKSRRIKEYRLVEEKALIETDDDFCSSEMLKDEECHWPVKLTTSKAVARAQRKALAGSEDTPPPTGSGTVEPKTSAQTIELALPTIHWKNGPYPVIAQETIVGKRCLVIDAAPAPPFHGSVRKVPKTVVKNALMTMIHRFANNQYSSVSRFTDTQVPIYYAKKHSNRVYAWLFSNVSDTQENHYDLVLVHIGSRHKEGAGKLFETGVRELL